MEGPLSRLPRSFVGLLCAVALTASCSGGETVVPPPPKPTRPPLPKTFTPTAQLPEGFPDYRETGSSVVRLDLEPARWDLSRIKLPEKALNVSDEFTVTFKELPNPKNQPRLLKILAVDLPFTLDAEDQTFRPEGVTVLVEGKEIEFSRTPAPKASQPTWRPSKNGRQLLVTYATLPPVGSVLVRTDRVKSAVERHDPKKAKDEDSFVHTSMTLGGETRHGLQLDAPSTGEWQVTLPARRATFESWLALQASPLQRPRSDGATVVLEVVADGKTAEAGRMDVVEPGSYTPFTADLSRWAGQAVTLRLESLPGDNANFDWVFVGSPIVTGPPAGDVRRVVVVALDTTRPDHTSFYGYDRPTPEIDAFASSGVAFDHTWSTAPRTRPSFRSSTTGRLPLDAVGATDIAEVFQRHDFVTAGIVANVHLQPRFDFDKGFDWWHFDGKARAEDEVDTALEWLQANTDRDAYLFVHFMDPHMPYDAPGEYRDKYVDATDPLIHPRIERSEVMGLMKQGRLTDAGKDQLRAEHDGEMSYLSSQLGRLFGEIDKLPGKTLVVLHSDHGEEFFEHGGFEHNHSVYDEVVRTLFVLRPGGGLPAGRHVTEPVTLMDLAPTLWDLFGFEDAPKVDGRTLVPELEGKEGAPRPLPVGYLQYAHDRWAVVWDGKKYVLHTGNGHEELYDLAADPKETKDLSATTDLAPFREQLAAAHHVEVGPGFRIFLALDRTKLADQPLEITLPAPAKVADVLDPELVAEYRANVEWGETPRRLPIDVGDVPELKGDRTKVTFVPGRSPHGELYVELDAPQDASAVTVTSGGKPVPVTATSLDPKTGTCLGPLCVVAGTVIVPPESEAERMGIAPGKGEASVSETLMLCNLGYMEGPQCDEAKKEAGTPPRSDDDRGEGGGEPEEGGEEPGGEGE